MILVAADVLKRLTDVFGKNNVYAEVQYHGLPAEQKVFSGIAALADAAGISLMATNDPFFVANTQKDIIAYKLLGFAYTKDYELTNAELEHYIKTPEQLKTSIEKILTPDQCKRAMQGRSDLASMCDVQIPTDTHYPSYCNDTGMTSDDLLRRTVENAIPHRCKSWTAEYEQRLYHELDVIKSKGFSDYLLIAADIVRFAKVDLKNSNNYLTVGPGRGSSAGSLVCYLLGITDIDPIPYGLMFERFISPSRSTMPDIDIDIAAGIRDEVASYVSTKYGVNAICGIYVPVCYRAKEAIAITGNYLSVKTGDREYDDIAQRMVAVCKDSSGVDDNLTELEALCKDKKGKAIIYK